MQFRDTTIHRRGGENCHQEFIQLRSRCRAPIGLIRKFMESFEQALGAYNLGRAEQARDCLEAILAGRPEHLPTLILLGVLAGESRDLVRALQLFDRALAIQPDNAWAHCNKAYVLLLSGAWDRGWQHYEWRWKIDGAAAAGFPGQRWLGVEPVAGKTILLRSEQGLGDTLQFCRYVKVLAQRGARVILEAPRPLVSLLADLEGVSQIVMTGSALPDFDYYCPLMSLPLAFKTKVDDVPCQSAYLVSDAAKTAEWRDRLGEHGVPRVGLVWSGSAANSGDRHRSLPLASLYELLPKNLCYVSLQKEVRAEDANTLKANPEILHFAEEQHDFSDTAALCECMDVVVSVDTSVAHMSAALGKPTWILLQFSPAWRWLLDRDDSPWYSSVRLFRQQVPGDWASVCERVGAQLQATLADPLARKRRADSQPYC
jgi:tetratricopeptide (TPR) repeat protein